MTRTIIKTMIEKMTSTKLKTSGRKVGKKKARATQTSPEGRRAEKKAITPPKMKPHRVTIASGTWM